MKSEASVSLDFLEGIMLGTRKLEINDIINTVDTFIHPFAKKKISFLPHRYCSSLSIVPLRGCIYTELLAP